jgi:diacylglycerol kinase
VASYEDFETIDIMTDARHEWRKNAKDTSVVAIGEKTHKFLKCEHVTKTDDLTMSSLCRTKFQMKFLLRKLIVFIAFTQCHVSFWLTESVLSRMNLLMDKFQIPSCRG